MKTGYNVAKRSRTQQQKERPLCLIKVQLSKQLLSKLEEKALLDDENGQTTSGHASCDVMSDWPLFRCMV